jgi:hypothetical protein
MENLSFEPHIQKSIDPEKMFLVRNFLQLYHAQGETKTGPISPIENGNEKYAEMTAEAIHTGEAFKKWMDKDGYGAIEAYVRTHSLEEVEHFADMDSLMSEYEAYHNRIVH